MIESGLLTSGPCLPGLFLSPLKLQGIGKTLLTPWQNKHLFSCLHCRVHCWKQLKGGERPQLVSKESACSFESFS